MKYLISTAAIGFIAFAFFSVSAPTPALAACNEVCVAKCKASAPDDVQGCIAKWSKINADTPQYSEAQKRRFENHFSKVNSEGHRIVFAGNTCSTGELGCLRTGGAPDSCAARKAACMSTGCWHGGIVNACGYGRQ
jgi:hypothetical protein